jgi:hypothetical protein
MSPNFIVLDASLPDVAKLVTAMVQARDAVERRSWTHPQEPTGEEWWTDVLADPRARKRERRSDLTVKQARHGCPVGRLCHLEVVHASDMLNEAVACVPARTASSNLACLSRRSARSSCSRVAGGYHFPGGRQNR